MQTSARHRTVLFASVAAAIALTSAGDALQDPGAGAPVFRSQEIARDFGIGYAVASGDVNGDGKTDILAISGTDLVWFKAPAWEKEIILGRGGDDGRQRDACAARYRRGRPARRRARSRVDWSEYRHAAVGQAECAGLDAGVGSVPHFRRADATSHPMGGRRWRQKAPTDRRAACTERGRKDRIGTVRPRDCSSSSHPPNPRTDPWQMEVAGEANHIQHNFLTFDLDGDSQDELVTASKEGLNALKRRRRRHVVTDAHRRGCARRGEARTRRRTANARHSRTLAWCRTGDLRRAARRLDEDNDRDQHSSRGTLLAGPTSTATAATSWWRAGEVVQSPDSHSTSSIAKARSRSKTMIDDGGMATEDLMVGDFNMRRAPGHRRLWPRHPQPQDLLERTEEKGPLASLSPDRCRAR